MSQLERCQTLLQGPHEGISLSISIKDNLLMYYVFFIDSITVCSQKGPLIKAVIYAIKIELHTYPGSVYTMQIYRKVEIAENA